MSEPLYSNSIWYEKYKPRKIQDLVLPEDIKARFQSFVEARDIPNLSLFSSIPGCGKSSIATALISETKLPAIWINASLDKGIDIIRGEIMTFASSCSFEDRIKIVVMDEFDNFTKDGQSAFRGFLDEFSSTCRFIFTGNSKNKVLEPLLNRTEVYDFNWSINEVAKPIFERLEYILQTEQVQYTRENLIEVIKLKYPSIRAMIGVLQRSVKEINGILTLDIASSISSTKTANELLKNAMISKNFEEVVKISNTFVNCDDFYSYMFEYVSKQSQELDLEIPQSQRPHVIITCAKYAHMSSSVRDKNLNLASCIFEILQKLNKG